ncbi:Cation-independent mannose-6-phosphate receptor CI-MPR [Coemansia sp. RSA 1933]|nr:Cation-independent mannose-6-phosphate receptor CI-MPR [Coemansia sp. RSA 1933]
MMQFKSKARLYISLPTFLLLLLSLLWQPVLALPSASAESSDCTIRGPSSQLEYDLRPLQLQSGGYVVDGLQSGYSFELGICRPLSDSSNTSVAARWQVGEATGAMGQANDRLSLLGDNVILEYTSGDICANSSQKRQSTQITFVCDTGVAGIGRPEFIAEWEQCAFIFLWRTPAACKIKAADDGIAADNDANDDDTEDDDHPAATSRGAAIFVAAFVFGSIYMLGGFLYNRVLNMSSGLRGIEQLPNYRFWRAIYLFGKHIVVGVASGIMFVVDFARRHRTGLIRIDSAELNMRSQIFDSTSEVPDLDDDEASYGDDRAATRA